MLLFHMNLKNGFNDHFKVGWKTLNSLLLPGSMIRWTECRTASQDFWYFTDVAGELGHIIYPFFATMKAVHKGLPPAEEPLLSIVATGIYSEQSFTATAQW